MSTGSESSDNGSDSDNGAVPSRASQNKPYKRPATSKRKHQQSKKLALAERLDKSDAQLKGAAMHNEVEKRRRAYLSHCYSALKLAVPGLEKSKASNVTVLRSAVDEIKKLEETGRQLEAAKAEQYRLRESLLKALPVRLPSRRASFLSLSLSLSLWCSLWCSLSLGALSSPAPGAYTCTQSRGEERPCDLHRPTLPPGAFCAGRSLLLRLACLRHHLTIHVPIACLTARPTSGSNTLPHPRPSRRRTTTRRTRLPSPTRRTSTSATASRT